MMPSTTKNNYPLIHVARISEPGSSKKYLFLRKVKDDQYTWYQDIPNEEEKETPISGNTVEEALRLAHRHWKNNAFRTVICGFRYTLPERDEHGTNALFSQMIKSYSSSNGIYLDPELGHPCVVHNASSEARDLMERLTKEKKL